MSNDHTEEKKLKVAVVLGSDPLRIAGALPILSFLKEHNVTIDLLVGSSGGAILSALWACGFDKEKTVELLTKIVKAMQNSHLDYRTLWGFLRPQTIYDPRHAFVGAGKLRRVFEEIFKDRKLEDLPQSIMLQATDAFTAKPVSLTRGKLSDIVYASQALFPVFPPLCVDGRWLVNGGYSTTLPVLEAVTNGMDIIIAIGIEARPIGITDHFISGAIDFISHSFLASHFESNALAVILHHREVEFIHIPINKEIENWDHTAIIKIIQCGEEALEAAKESILLALAA